MQLCVCPRAFSMCRQDVLGHQVGQNRGAGLEQSLLRMDEGERMDTRSASLRCKRHIFSPHFEHAFRAGVNTFAHSDNLIAYPELASFPPYSFPQSPDSVSWALLPVSNLYQIILRVCSWRNHTKPGIGYPVKSCAMHIPAPGAMAPFCCSPAGQSLP